MSKFSDALKAVAKADALLTVEDGNLILTVPAGKEMTADEVGLLLEHREQLIKQFTPSPRSVPTRNTPHPVFQKQSPPWDSAREFTIWNGEIMGDTIALDCETDYTPTRPRHVVPPLVLTSVWDGEEGYFVECEDLERFIATHDHSKFVTHNGAGFDAHVIDHHLSPDNPRQGPVHRLIDEHRLIDTLLMERLIDLAILGECLPKRGRYSLQTVAKKYTDYEIEKDEDIRNTFGPYLGRSVSAIPDEHLEYAAVDVIATLAAWQGQTATLPGLKMRAKSAFGYQDEDQLDYMWSHYGPLTLFSQVKTETLCFVMSQIGLHADQDRIKSITTVLTEDMATAEKVLNEAGIPTKAQGSKSSGKDKAINEYLSRLEQEHNLKMDRTPTGKISACEKSLVKLSKVVTDPVIEAVQNYKTAEKRYGSYIKKWNTPHLHPEWNSVLVTGRISASGDVSAQNVPRDGKERPGEFSVKQALRPAPGHAFVGFDVAGAEIATFAVALHHQFDLGKDLLKILNSGLDVHMTVAHLSVGDRFGPVTKTERKMAKAVTFGLPGGLAPATLKEYALSTFGVVMTDQDVARVIKGYQKLNPAIKKYLAKTKNLGDSIKQYFGLTSRNMGWNLFQIGRGKSTNLSKHVRDIVWKALKVLPDRMIGTKSAKEEMRSIISRQVGNDDLGYQIKKLVDTQTALSMTGRFRGRCGFTQARNNTFQSLAADAALEATWELYKAGYDVAGFIHDEIIVQVPLKDANKTTVHTMMEIATKAMAKVLKGFEVTLEPFIRTSLSGKDELEWEHVEELPPPDAFCKPKPELQIDSEPDIVDGQIMFFTAPEPKPRKRRDQANTQGRKQAKDSAEFLF